MQSVIFYSIVLACMYLSWGMIGLYVAGGYIAISLLRALYFQSLFEELKPQEQKDQDEYNTLEEKSKQGALNFHDAARFEELKKKIESGEYTARVQSDDYQNQPSVWAQKHIDSMRKGRLSLFGMIFLTAVFMLPYYGFWSYVVCILMLIVVLKDLFHSCIYACMWMKHVTYKNNVLKTIVDSMITMSYYSVLYSLYYGSMYYILTLSFGILGLYICVASGVAECINYVIPKYKLEDAVEYFFTKITKKEISFYNLDVVKFQLAFFVMPRIILVFMCTPYNGVWLYIATVCLTATAVDEMGSAIYWTIYNIRKNVLIILEHRGHGDYSYGIFKSFIFFCTFIGSAYFLLHIFGYNACYILVPYAIIKYMYSIQYNKSIIQDLVIIIGLCNIECENFSYAIGVEAIQKLSAGKSNKEEVEEILSKLVNGISSYPTIMHVGSIVITYLITMPIIAWCVLPMVIQCSFVPYYIVSILIVTFIIADMLMSSLQLMGAMSCVKKPSPDLENKIKTSKFYNEMKKKHQPTLISFIHYLNTIDRKLNPTLNIDTTINNILNHEITSLPGNLDLYCEKYDRRKVATVAMGLKEDSSISLNRQVLRYIPQTGNPTVSSKEIQENQVSSTQSNTNTVGQNSLFQESPSNKESFEDSNSEYSMSAID